VISNAPEIVSFEDAGSAYVENGSGEKYLVKYANGSTVEVEISDTFDPESSDLTENDLNRAESEEDRDPKQIYNIRVVFDGAVDFSESYDANDSDDCLRIKKALITRYGRIAEDFTGLNAPELQDQIAERRDESDSESFV
jgi:hypothetical protein